jgi:hypothetical protein
VFRRELVDPVDPQALATACFNRGSRDCSIVAPHPGRTQIAVDMHVCGAHGDARVSNLLGRIEGIWPMLCCAKRARNGKRIDKSRELVRLKPRPRRCGLSCARSILSHTGHSRHGRPLCAKEARMQEPGLACRKRSHEARAISKKSTTSCFHKRKARPICGRNPTPAFITPLAEI